MNKAETDGGATPLYIACYEGNVEIIKLLLAQSGIEVNKAAGFTCSPRFMVQPLT